MKRILLIGFILAICILAMPQGVLAAQQSSNVPISALYAGSPLAFQAALSTDSGANSVNPWQLVRGTDNGRTNALVFTVSDSEAWTVTATGSNGGYFAGVTNSAHSLINPFWMEFSPNGVRDGAQHNIIGGPAVLNGGPIPDGSVYYSNVWQRVTDADFGDAGGYTLTITFTATSPF
jgi:hypothetical protein